MAQVKQKGGYEGSGDSISKRLGIKLFDGQRAAPGNIIVRQRGTKFVAGKNVKKGGDDSLYATAEGTVKFCKKRKTAFDGSRKVINLVSVE